jgi:hypothetical protein
VSVDDKRSIRRRSLTSRRPTSTISNTFRRTNSNHIHDMASTSSTALLNDVGKQGNEQHHQPIHRSRVPSLLLRARGGARLSSRNTTIGTNINGNGSGASPMSSNSNGGNGTDSLSWLLTQLSSMSPTTSVQPTLHATPIPISQLTSPTPTSSPTAPVTTTPVAPRTTSLSSAMAEVPDDYFNELMDSIAPSSSSSNISAIAVTSSLSLATSTSSPILSTSSMVSLSMSSMSTLLMSSTTKSNNVPLLPVPPSLLNNTPLVMTTPKKPAITTTSSASPSVALSPSGGGPTNTSSSRPTINGSPVRESPLRRSTSAPSIGSQSSPAPSQSPVTSAVPREPLTVPLSFPYSQSISSMSRYTRFIVLEVIITKEGREKILRLIQPTSSSNDICDPNAKKVHAERRAILRDDWYYTRVARGDYVNIIGQFHYPSASSSSSSLSSLLSASSFTPLTPSSADTIGSSPWIVLNNRNASLLILHPDTLISGTRVGQSYPCVRSAVLSEVFQSSGVPALAALQGTMAHDIFQESLLSGDFSENTLQKHVDQAIHEHIYDLYVFLSMILHHSL